MDWVRTHIRWGARLALIALALQIALSFGHVHPIAAPSKAIGQIASANGPDEPDHHHRDAADLCAICAVMAMANTLLDASPPALPPPLAALLRHRIAAATAADPGPAASGFQPRAPPVS